MRSEYLYTLLKIIQEGTIESLGLLEAFLTSRRNTKLLNQKLKKLEGQRLFKRMVSIEKEDEMEKELRKYRLLFYKLKKDGLVVEKARDNKVSPSLTKDGKEKLNNLMAGYLFSPHRYCKELSKNLVIVIFDIPEIHRNRRGWLRSVLRNLGFTMIQKSVWVGKSKIPRQFIDDLHKLSLSSYVEIFQVVKLGSIETE